MLTTKAILITLLAASLIAIAVAFLFQAVGWEKYAFYAAGVAAGVSSGIIASNSYSAEETDESPA